MQRKSELSRRALLSGAAASLALPWLPRASRAAWPTVSEIAWWELGKNITGGVLRPNDPRFVRLTQPENLRYYNPPANPGGAPDPDAPFGVVRPHTPQEVAYAIKWARDNNLPMVPRSGGHSYAGCSTVPGLVISSDAMQTVKFENGMVVAGGGALFGNLLTALRDFNDGNGPYTITHGRCRGVGLSAYLMGGGWALDSAHAGMGCDRVQKVEIVLADGRCVMASDDDKDKEHRDLFWAVRGGGGGNLGFATRWWLKPLSVGNVTVLSRAWRLGEHAQFVFQTLLRALDVAPDKMGAEMTVSMTSGTVKTPWRYRINLSCQFHGPKTEFDAILGFALAAADQAAAKDCSIEGCSSKDELYLPYWDAQEFFELEVSPNRYQETSLFAPEVSDDFIDEIFRILPTWPGTVAGAELTAYRTGGKVNTVASDAMAFVHRSSKWIVTTDIGWTGRESQHDLHTNLRWQRNVQNTFSLMLGRPGSYYNFPDPGLDNHAQAYWGKNYWRLLQVKGRYDPDFVFTPPRNQGIAP